MPVSAAAPSAGHDTYQEAILTMRRDLQQPRGEVVMIGDKAALCILWTLPAIAVGAVRRMALAVALALVTATGAVAQDGQSREANGLVVYLGVLPAAMVKGHNPVHPEATMHGGAPGGPHEYHLLVAVFDAATGARVEDASVAATITGLGHIGGTRIGLEPMKIADTTTYGNFVDLPGSDLYTIGVTIKRASTSQPLAFEFSYDHRSQ
jgi:hypothetical protein